MSHSAFHGLIIASGIWRAVLMTPGGELPFNFETKEVNGRSEIFINNGDENIEVNEISYANDSLIIQLPVYDSEFRVSVAGDSMKGYWYNNSRKNYAPMPFKAFLGENYRFIKNAKSEIKLPEKWEWKFSPDTKDSSEAVALFKQDGTDVRGTLLTESGDYRFLHGSLNNDSLFLSYFDGAFAYLFKASVKNNTMNGVFYSGHHWQQPWQAVVNENAELPDPFKLTFLKSDTTPFSFSALRLDSTVFSFPNKELKGRVVIVEMMGTWCPNCMDETAFLSDYYAKITNQDLTIIGLAFEKTSDFRKSVSNVKRVKDRYHVQYETLIAGNREGAASKMSMLSKINGYPTTIFIDRKGKVRKIYTGFNGPATGAFHERTKDDFIRIINTLLSEK